MGGAIVIAVEDINGGNSVGTSREYNIELKAEAKVVNKKGKIVEAYKKVKELADILMSNRFY